MMKRNSIWDKIDFAGYDHFSRHVMDFGVTGTEELKNGGNKGWTK